jgi:hypothetical protein
VRTHTRTHTQTHRVPSPYILTNYINFDPQRNTAPIINPEIYNLGKKNFILHYIHGGNL